MNNENGLQAISLDEMQAIEGGNQVQDCGDAVLRGGLTGAGIGGRIGGLFGPAGRGIGAGLGALAGAAYAAATDEDCRALL